MSRWLELNGGTGNGLNSTERRRYLSVTRPEIEGHKSIRVCKDWTYLNVIRSHCKMGDVRGPYLGLAAAHIPEILTALYPHVEQEFTSCQLRRTDYKLVSEFLPHVQEAYQYSTNINFFVEHQNILDWMESGGWTYSIFDLDMMGWLTKEVVDKVVAGMQWSGEDRCVLAIWHSSNRETGGGRTRVEQEYRPYMMQQINKEWFIFRHDEVYYYESQRGSRGTPMHVDVFTLERKWKKAS
jgi:hypothetical protein